MSRNIKRKKGTAALESPMTYGVAVNSSGAREKYENQVENTHPEELVHNNLRSMDSFIPENKMSAEKKKKIDKQLVKLCTTGLLPFDIVEGKGFRSFVKALNPAYELPSKKVLSSTLFPAMYEECYKEVQAKIKKEPVNVCLTTDCWTSSANDTYMAVTIHYINDNFEFNSVLLECVLTTESDTSLNLANHLERITDEWCLSGKILMALSDNSTNIKNAMENHLEWNHLGCYAHTLNVIVQNALEDETLEHVIKKVRTIVSHFKQSDIAMENLIKRQSLLGIENPKRLKQDVQTMWNSTYLMLRRMVELREVVQSSLELLDEDLPILSPEEWLICAQLCRVLKPFEQSITDMCDGDYMMARLFVFLINGSIFVCDKLLKHDFHKNVRFCIVKLKEGLQQRMLPAEISETLAICSFLDPRFKQHIFSEEQASIVVKTKDSLIRLVTERMDKEPKRILTTPPTSLWYEFDKAVCEAENLKTSSSKALLEVENYMNYPMVTRHENIFEWWKWERCIFPNLAEIFKTKCGLVASSVPCARLYSKEGYNLNEYRATLSASKVTKSVFLSANLQTEE